MAEQVTVNWHSDEGECRIPKGAIGPDTIECLEDLDVAIAAFDAANLEYPDRVHVAEWEECESTSPR